MLLDGLLVVVRLFQFAFFLLTWPVRALVWLVARKHEATSDRQQYERAIAEGAMENAVREKFEREQAAHRAAGEYVPHLDRFEIYSICGMVAEVYGYANEVYRRGMPPRLTAALEEIHARFGARTAAVFGTNPQSTVQPNIADYRNCLAASAIIFISDYPRGLEIVTIDNGTPVLRGHGACARLGVFAHATGSKPEVKFMESSCYDHFYVAANFIPDQASAESHYYRWREHRERWERHERSGDPMDLLRGASIESPVRSGSFGPQLTWLTELLFPHRQDT